MKKNTTLELTVCPEYVQNWGVWEAIRELLQNAYDAADQGYAASIKRTRNALKIRNEGTTIERETLLLGATTKTGTDQRGKYGEGYKLAFLVLLRNGYKVILRTGNECWEPFIGPSSTFNRETLQVKIRPATYKNRISVEVEPIDDENWDLITRRCLLLNPPNKNEVVEVGANKLLLGNEYKGLLFSQGLYVGKIPSEYSFGYDLVDVKLDRDRRLADPWSFRYSVRYLLKGALDAGFILPEQLYKLLLQDGGEAESLADYYKYQGGDDLTKHVAALFRTHHGEDAVPVSSMSESAEAGHFGLKGVVLPRRLVTLVEKETGNLESRKTTAATEGRHVYSWDELSKSEQENFLWLMEIGKRIPEFNSGDITVVDFIGENVYGTYLLGAVRLAKKILNDRQHSLIALVHEIAHCAGSDGSVEHRDAMDRIYAGLVVGG